MRTIYLLHSRMHWIQKEKEEMWMREKIERTSFVSVTFNVEYLNVQASDQSLWARNFFQQIYFYFDLFDERNLAMLFHWELCLQRISISLTRIERKINLGYAWLDCMLCDNVILHIHLSNKTKQKIIRTNFNVDFIQFLVQWNCIFRIFLDHDAHKNSQ